ncbi:hypothetical protein HOY80DRAFT_996209 [Tuber brumale]|nr:hypothetical protein HOY80DRAFT_996209 [Tuber brumale]
MVLGEQNCSSEYLFFPLLPLQASNFGYSKMFFFLLYVVLVPISCITVMFHYAEADASRVFLLWVMVIPWHCTVLVLTHCTICSWAGRPAGL